MKFKYLFLSLIILCSQITLAAEISGTVYLEKNKHKNALGHTTMRMHVYKDNYEFSGAEIKTDSSGRYVFRNLKDDPQYSYLFYPVYEGVNYPFEEVTFSKGKVVEKKDFTLTESTGSNKDVSVDEKIYFDLGKKDVWKITHEIILENKGDLLYHADRSDAQPLMFSLFEGGFDMSYLDGVTRNNSKIDEQKDSLQVFLTIPGHQASTIKFSYYYIPGKRHVTFEKTAHLARSNVSLFFNNRVRIISTQFQNDPMMAKTQMEYARAFTSGPIEQNGTIRFEIKGFFLTRDLLHMTVLAACLALIVFILFFIFTQKHSTKNPTKELTEKMHQYLVDLEKKHKEGKIDEQFYKKEDHRVRNFLFQMSKSNKK